MKILIPTCRPIGEIGDLYAKLSNQHETWASCLPASAAVNRNWCLDHVQVGEIAIMIDDDIEGFYAGWVDDLVLPLIDPSVVMVSARLLNPDGSFGPTCSRCYDASPDEIEVKSNGTCIIPTAAIAFRHRGFKFEEKFVGSGWEDNDWAMQYLEADPNCKFIQSNRCRLIHRNERKHQGGRNWKHNEALFFNKWYGRNRRSPVQLRTPNGE